LPVSISGKSTGALRQTFMNDVKDTSKINYRFENFGGIISSHDPPFLAFVDRDYMRQLGAEESGLWETDDESIGKLTAPTEVHFAITNKCSVGCPHCYMDAGKQDDGELDTASFKRALDVLAEMKVFHIALGGGEALEREDLFEIAEYARTKGLMPNLTTSGSKLTAEIAKKMKVFGQVNVSLDGVGSSYAVFRNKDMFSIADNAIDYLIGAGVPTGINCVLGKNNFDSIAELFEYASKKGINEIEFLRLKPSGRGMEDYLRQRTTNSQNISLAPMLSEFSLQYGVTAKIDCSFVPMFCYHNPPPELLEAIATYGCEAGNVLLGIRSNGIVSGCSFMKDSALSVFDLKSGLNRSGPFEQITSWLQNPPQPCKSCDYLAICKGGCHAVSEYVTGDFNNPDPDCPKVVEYKMEKH
jgi:radical SAM protein with 4Fe4S-binding SPASM domain